MAEPIEVKFDTKAIEKLFNKFPEETFDRLKVAFGVQMAQFVGRFTKSRLSGRSGSKGLNRVTGTLARNLLTKTFGKKPDINTIRTTAFFTTQVPYAKIHEFGGEIRPTKQQALTIPLPAAKTASGALKAPAREWGNTFIVKTKNGEAIIAQKNGNSLIPLFALKKKVTIPPRLGFFAAWGKERNVLVKNINKEVVKLTKEFSAK